MHCSHSPPPPSRSLSLLLFFIACVCVCECLFLDPIKLDDAAAIAVAIAPWLQCVCGFLYFWPQPNRKQNREIKSLFYCFALSEPFYTPNFSVLFKCVALCTLGSLSLFRGMPERCPTCCLSSSSSRWYVNVYECVNVCACELTMYGMPWYLLFNSVVCKVRYGSENFYLKYN